MSSDKDSWVEGDLFHASGAVAAVGICSQEKVIAAGNAMRSVWCDFQSACLDLSAHGSSTASGCDGLLEMAHCSRSQIFLETFHVFLF